MTDTPWIKVIGANPLPQDLHEFSRIDLSLLDPNGCPEIVRSSNELFWPSKDGRGRRSLGTYYSIEDAEGAAQRLAEKLKAIQPPTEKSVPIESYHALQKEVDRLTRERNDCERSCQLAWEQSRKYLAAKKEAERDRDELIEWKRERDKLLETRDLSEQSIRRVVANTLKEHGIELKSK
jgi:hypothetical protein